ncbi:hypothetical protein V8C44DRAFT_317985 [Trichoderma aethiopicum]
MHSNKLIPIPISVVQPMPQVHAPATSSTMQLYPRNCPERSRPGLPRCLQMPQVQEMPAANRALALERPRPEMPGVPRTERQ